MRRSLPNMHKKRTVHTQIIRQGDKCWDPSSSTILWNPLCNNKCGILCARGALAIFFLCVRIPVTLAYMWGQFICIFFVLFLFKKYLNPIQ